MTEFFRKSEVCVMTVKELFDFVTDINVTEENMEEYLEEAQALAQSRPVGERTVEEEISEAVFQKVFIPRTLNEVATYEKDFIDMQEGRGGDILYPTITGLKPDLSGPQTRPQLLQKTEDGEK